MECIRYVGVAEIHEDPSRSVYIILHRVLRGVYTSFGCSCGVRGSSIECYKRSGCSKDESGSLVMCIRHLRLVKVYGASPQIVYVILV